MIEFGLQLSYPRELNTKFASDFLEGYRQSIDQFFRRVETALAAFAPRARRAALAARPAGTARLPLSLRHCGGCLRAGAVRIKISFVTSSRSAGFGRCASKPASR